MKKAVLLMIFSFLLLSPVKAEANPFAKKTESPASETSVSETSVSETSVSETEKTEQEKTGKNLFRKKPIQKKAEKPSFLSHKWALFMLYQKKLNREITGYMKAVHKGDNFWAILSAFGLTFVYGVLHAIGPGHGKVFVASYFMANNVRALKGVLMGFIIGITHVSSAVIVVSVADKLVKFVMGTGSEELVWIKLISYGAITAMGLFLLIKSLMNRKDINCQETEHSHQDDLKSMIMLGLGIGMIPCPGALLIMLYALTKGMIFLGVLLVAAMAAGIGITLSSVGLLVIKGRSRAMKLFENKSDVYNRIILSLQVAGSLLMVIIGSILFVSVL